jgi:hypothetical protein
LAKILIGKENVYSFEELEVILVNAKLQMKSNGNLNKKAMFTKEKGISTNFLKARRRKDNSQKELKLIKQLEPIQRS